MLETIVLCSHAFTFSFREFVCLQVLGLKGSHLVRSWIKIFLYPSASFASNADMGVNYVRKCAVLNKSYFGHCSGLITHCINPLKIIIEGLSCIKDEIQTERPINKVVSTYGLYVL